MTGYALRFSEAERGRYLFMAERARADEAGLWAAAGIVPGAHVVDLGCGPGATLVTMAQVVGPDGSVTGVDGDPEAVAAALEMIAAAGLDNATARVGEAAAAGLLPGAVDVAVYRHVLAHNGRREQELVDAAAALVRPGGCVYLVDVDVSMIRMQPTPPVMEEIRQRYAEFHAGRGNDLQVGLRLGDLLTAAGLELVAFEGRLPVVNPPPGMRPPAWAARDAMRAAGLVDDADLARWDAFFAEADASPSRPLMFLPSLHAVGRRPV
jgi:SAM-dependent methyltransferase